MEYSSLWLRDMDTKKRRHQTYTSFWDVNLTPSKLYRTCLKTFLSSEDCTREEDRRETAKRKNQEGKCWTYLWSKRKRSSVTRNWREEHRAGLDSAIVIGTCLRAEHAKKKNFLTQCALISSAGVVYFLDVPVSLMYFLSFAIWRRLGKCLTGC